ncbi:hypothetical protein So717_03830 [Roseobacter cerasinus]|uniref:Transposase n=1 Tax=Roseobacter cerasinus TaxID=2602289 RepID=A0A640VMI5_9RHOB|nr:hypothetical protein So717_03830 [Roseobacter cerasinus]
MVDRNPINKPPGGKYMAHYVGIDASFETANVCVVDDDGNLCLERKIEAEPDAIVESVQ